MRRKERGTVQGPVKEQQPDGMSHRGAGRAWGEGGGGGGAALHGTAAHPGPHCQQFAPMAKLRGEIRESPPLERSGAPPVAAGRGPHRQKATSPQPPPPTRRGGPVASVVSAAGALTEGHSAVDVCVCPGGAGLKPDTVRVLQSLVITHCRRWPSALQRGSSCFPGPRAGGQRFVDAAEAQEVLRGRIVDQWEHCDAARLNHPTATKTGEEGLGRQRGGPGGFGIFWIFFFISVGIF